MAILQTVLTLQQINLQQINNLIANKTVINEKYNNYIAQTQSNYNNNLIGNDEKNTKITQFNASRTEELQNVDSEIQTLKTQNEINSNDPYKNVIKQNTLINNSITSNSKTSTSYSSTLSKEQSSKISGNITKTLIPIITLQLTNQLVTIGNQNKKIEDIVNTTNTFINNIQTQNDINKAQILRNSALNVINNNENKILSIKNIFTQLNSFISIFSLLITTLSLIPTPVGAPTGVGLPLNVITGVSKSIENANKLVLGLNTVIGIGIVILSRMITDLENLSSQLETINGLLDTAATTQLSGDQLSSFLSSLTNNTTNLGSYKGFTFVLKEEENPLYVIEGNKRHYAVAINTSGIQVLQSDYSFTLDPSQLVDQLELEIDQSGLTA
jgi:hypothetical protein